MDLGPKVVNPSGPVALQTGEINTIGAKQVIGVEGPEQKQVRLFFGETFVKLPTQMSGSCQEKGSCRRGVHSVMTKYTRDQPTVSPKNSSEHRTICKRKQIHLV